MAAMTCVTRATCRAASKGERTQSTFLSRPARAGARSPRTLADPLPLSLSLLRSCAATRRQTSAKVVLKPIGDNNADYVIRSGLNQPPQATAITVSENPGNSQIPRQHAFEKADLDLRLQPSLRLDLTLLSRFEPLLRSFSSAKLTAGTSVVGRDEASDLIIPIPTVSGSHAKVEVLGDSVYVTDLKSTNGTFVQDEKIKPETKTEVSLVLRPLAPPNAAGPPKADAVPSHSHLPGQGRAERHLRGLQPRKLHGPAGGRRVRWGWPSSWRGRGHGLAFSLRAPRTGTIFFSHL